MINNLSRGLSPPFSPTTPSVTQTTPTRIFNLASSVPRPPPISINPTLRRSSPTITSNNNPAVSNQRTKPNIPSHSTSLSSTLTELELLERLDWDLRTGRNDQLSIRRDSDGSILTDGVRDRWGNRWSLENHVLSPVISERTEPSRTDVSSPTSNLSVSSYSTSANNRRLRSNVSTSSSSTSKSSSSSSTTTTPSSSTSAVVIDHPLPNLENYTKSLDQNLPQTDSNCQLSSLEGDHEQFILSLHRNTLNSRGDSKNNHQSSHLKQLRAQQARERDLAIADRQIQKRLERENREKVSMMRRRPSHRLY
ncbi:hypothetical protein BY996DRAFT_1131003 [Phakopsora pachyrhizi]|nr:hypothetical protein BY996DRAFT_1131003 [Phakopsora pachyrhizi]